MSTPTVDHLPVETRDAISELFLQGRRVSEVIAQGLNRPNGWRRGDVIDLVSARGWKLDSDGRIPRQYRTSAVVPIAPAPASWPERGTVTVDRGEPVTKLIADGKAHTVARVRKLADKAEAALADLRKALRDESGKEEIRRRLAELDAERDRLRAQLAGPGRPKAATAAAPSGSGKPIDHGSWGGYLAHNKRGEDACADCERGKDEHMAAMRARKVTA